MENILAGLFVLAIIGGVIAVGVWAHKYAMKKKREDEERLASQRKAADEYWASKRKAARFTSASNIPSQAAKAPDPVKTEYVSTSRSSDNSDDGFLTGMLMGTVLNQVLHNSSSPSVGVTTNESSWGLDDSDSRKSISSSMSDSYSSSSSDSWSSSSSDSGPSSDW